MRRRHLLLRTLVVTAVACSSCRREHPTDDDPRERPVADDERATPPDRAPPVEPEPEPSDELPIDGPVAVFPGLPWVPNPPGRMVAIKPVFAVPTDGRAPTPAERMLAAQHVQIAQARYHELLEEQDTFAVESTPDVVTLTHDTAWYVEHSPAFLPGTAALTGELLDHYGLDRHRAPFVFVIIVMSNSADIVFGNAMPLNGGHASGGGAVSLSLPHLMSPNFQSTLQHELGHAFGLPHVDVYGYDMAGNDSIMSYNLAHHTDGLEPGVGLLIPEDLFALDKATRIFPEFTWSGAEPSGYARAPAFVMPAMPIEGHPWEVIASTADGEEFGSTAGNAVQGLLVPSSSDAGFDASVMWHTAYDLAPGTFVGVDLELPVPVRLSGLAVHSEHSGLYHRSDHLRVTTLDDQVVRVDQPLAGADARVTFAPFVAQRLRVQLRVPASGAVTVRGLRFFEGALELFPPLDVPPAFD